MRKKDIPIIANLMMKGAQHVKYAPGSTEEQREEFRNRYAVLIELMSEFFPTTVSHAVSAVIVKCALRYGLEKGIAFGKAIKFGNFKGQNDPIHHLFNMLFRYKGYDTVETYQRTITAARAYCEGRTLTELRPASKDIIEWDENWHPIVKKEDNNE